MPVPLSPQLCLFDTRQRTERRSVGPGDKNPKFVLQNSRETLCGAGDSPKEKMPVGATSLSAKLVQQVASTDPASQPMSLNASEPYQRRTISHDQVCRIQ